MAKLYLLVFQFCVLLCRARLLANYRLWDSWGEVLYDFSGLQNHARVLSLSTSEMVLTERGLFLSKGQISLPENLFDLGLENYTALIAFWYLPLQSSRLITLDRNSKLGVDIEMYPNYTLYTYTLDRAALTHAVQEGMSKGYFESWTLVILQLSTKGNELNMTLFFADLIPELGYNFGDLDICVKEISLSIGDLYQFEGYLYEIWCLTHPADIQVIYSGYNINYPFRIQDLIPQDLSDPYSNSIAEYCSQSCRELGLSCYSYDRNICIPSYNIECNHGWYNLTHPRCISPCPRGCECKEESNICISCMLNYTLVDNHCIPENDYNNSRFLDDTCSIGKYSCQTGCCACQAFCDSCMINTSNVLECLSCSSNYYIYYITSFICVSNCPDEYYKGTSTPFKCNKCIANCQRCNDGVSCMKCNIGYFLKGNICVQDCGVGYYNNVMMSTCDACSSGCISCSSALCSQCDNSNFNLDGTCVVACGSGYYENSISKICERCSNNCQGCSYTNTILTCLECISGSYLKNGVCLNDCGSGYYSNSITKTCEECTTSNCDRCDSSLVCMSCLPGLGLQTISGNLVCQSCPFKTYLNNGACLPCINLCKICSNSATCDQCVNHAYIWEIGCRCEFGYIASNNECNLVTNFNVLESYMYSNGNLYFSFNQKLKDTPTASQFAVMINSISYDSSHFKVYPVKPLISYQINMLDISLFEGSFYAYVIFPSSSNILVSETNIPLSITEVKIPIRSSFSSVVNCITIPNCNVCYLSLNGKYICGTCNLGYCLKMIYPYPCSSCCDPGFFKHSDTSSNCYPCSAICATCDKLGCTSCKSGRYLLNRDCIIECGVGYYENTTTNTCSACFSNCSECNDSLTCNICAVGYVLNDDNSACLVCESGTYYENRSCFNCPLLCLECSSSNLCSACIENAEVRNEGICYCKLGYIYSNNACIFTVFHAEANIDTNQNIYLMFDKQLMNTLLSSDIQFTVLSIIYTSSSFTFVETSINQVYMIRILGLNYLEVNSFTLNILSYDSIYAVDQSKLYESSITVYICPLECATCNADLCFSCVYGYFLKNNACIIDCGVGYVGNTDTKECQICPSNCMTCGYVSTDLVCSACIQNYTLELIQGEYQCIECLPGNYIKSNKCLPCPNQCRECYAKSSCTSCTAGYYLEDEMCIESKIHPTATMTSLHTILLTFDKTLIVPLYSSSLSILIRDKSYLSPSFELSEISINQIYSISLNNIDIKGLSSITLYFTDTSSILSEDYSILKDSSVTISVPIEIGCPSTCNTCYIESGYYLCGECKVGYIKMQDGRCIEPIALCEEYNIIDEIIYCIRCKDFSYMFDGVNCECFDLSNQEYDDRCPVSCPKGMIMNNTLYTCIYESESNSSNSTITEDDTNQDVEDVSESSYTIEEIKQAENVRSTVSIVNSVNYACSGASVASGGGYGWSLISTIQIFSFLPLISVEVPLFLKRALKAQEDYLPAYDLFEDIQYNHSKPHKQAREFKYKYSNFIINSGKPIFIFAVIILIHLLSKILVKYTRGRIRNKIESIYNMFYYGVYLRYFIQIYLEILIAASLQLQHVTLI